MLLLAISLTTMGKNTKTNVEQVTESITLSEDVDYVVKGATPFTNEGLVNITNTEHGVLIIERVKPSKVIASLLESHVRINGQTARDGVNCQVRLYGSMGSMILPYSNDKPLTVYSEQNFQGDQCNDFGLENDGGYMVTLSDRKLNNRIRSFRLKRGYMVTFATQQSGYGYQRCFIANDQDMEVSTLPKILDGKISSYRIFRWNTAGKKGLASSTDGTACDKLNVISCYGWDTGRNMYPDVECVANHLYEDWPSSSACGKATWTCHMKTNNEPLNSADPNPQSLSTILGNWQNLMRTGMRLCSPSSWDGSDYTDGSGFLKSFFDAIDARGWRCDIADLHCYWLTDIFDKIPTMQSKYKRPIWVSEWIWGASWNHNGAFESGKTKWDNQWGVQTISSKMNNMACVERYFYWNSESSVSKVYEGGLTPAGEWYASQLTGMGYNPSYEKIPNEPPMKGGFSNYKVTVQGSEATVSWHDYDGEYNQVMEVLRRAPGSLWEVWQTVKPKDAEADYQLVDQEWTEGVDYMLHIRSYSGKDYWSQQGLEAGAAYRKSDGTQAFAGGNVIPNGDFRMGMYGWLNGEGQPIGMPLFEVFPNKDGGYFLQAFGHGGKDGAASLKTAFDIVPQQEYVLSLASQNAGTYIKLDARKKGESGDKNKLTMTNLSSWGEQQACFNSDDADEALLAFRWLDSKAQLGHLQLCRLFPTYEEAVADGVEQARKQAAFICQWNTQLTGLNNELEQCINAMTGQDQSTLKAINQAIDNLLQGISDKAVIDSLLIVAHAMKIWEFDGRETLIAAIEQAQRLANATAGQMASIRQQLQEALDGLIIMTPAAIQPASANLASTDGWQVKTGTFTGGDQRLATKLDKTCWNAWWSGINAEEGNEKTMEIRQELSGLPEGLYSLECKALTEHYCLSDQHGFLSTGTETAVTPQLTSDFLDIPNTISAWQTLTSTPIYVSANDVLTIGFTGSKQGATDKAWRCYGMTENQTMDNREGWWCATDFRLLYHPLFKFNVTPQQWGTVCLPYAYSIPKNVKLYKVAGLTSDFANVCIEEVTEAEQGHPYIYVSESAQTVYYTKGEALTEPVNIGTNYLNGTFTAEGMVPKGAYELRTDGQWYRITDEQHQNVAYTAFISKASRLPILDDWNGLTMPIHGVEEEIGEVTGIEGFNRQNTNNNYYTIGGQQATRKPAGLHIEVDGKQARKVFMK